MKKTAKIQELPRDNASRLAIYDAICEYTKEADTPGITDDELFERVIGRLRVLVPRELHLVGDRPYVDEKIEACLQAGIIVASYDNGGRVLTYGQPPQVRFPDRSIRDYPAGLELARERLDRDNAHLRSASFNVRKFIPSIADKPDGPHFQNLLASMREHGFMKQFAIVKYLDDSIVDGIARQKAAEKLKIKIEFVNDRIRKEAQRRETPLNRVLVALDSNRGRLTSDIVELVHNRVEDLTRRSWEETAADLALTQEWRGTTVADYKPEFQVTMRAYRDDDEPRVQVTADDKVMMASLMRASGLSNYKVGTELSPYVAFEDARSAYSPGQKAHFARAQDLITGIATMQQERRAAGLKLDPEWEEIRSWLVRNFQEAHG